MSLRAVGIVCAVLLTAGCTAAEVDAFCREKGTLPNVPLIVTRGLRFTPNLCDYYWGDAVCRAAASPVLSSTELLLRGFEFVEYDIGAGQTSHPNSGKPTQLVRLHLADRPNAKCLWIDEQINKDSTIVLSALERRGISRDKCIAADFDESSRAQYRFVLTTTEPEDSFLTRVLKVELVNSSTDKVYAEIHNIQVGGGDKSAGLSCRNAKERAHLLDVVVPLKP